MHRPMSRPRTPLWRALAAGCLAATLVVLASCRSSSAPQSPPNVILIVVDTLRADRVGAYGGPRGLTPTLDRFVQDGATVFTNAYAQASSTSPSIASLLTSRYAFQHGLVANKSKTMRDEETSLAEIASGRGYATGAFVSNLLLNHKRGFAQGFDKFQLLARPFRLPKPRGEVINRAALAWVDEARKASATRPIFLYVHYLEPHTPYTVDRASVEQTLTDRARPPGVREAAWKLLADVPMQRWLGVGIPFGDDGVQAVLDLYDTEVASVDKRIGELLAGLKKRGLLNDAVVVVTADHGEEFLEHGRVGHDAALYNETVEIPMLFRVPGSRVRREVADVVSLIDIAPTLLDLIGAPAAPTFEGRSLRPLLDEPPLWERWFGSKKVAERSAFLEQDNDTVRGLGNHRRALVLGADKAILDRNGTMEFFDLAADPGETQPGALSPERRRRLVELLDETARRAAVDGDAAPPQELDEEDKERLRALGYME
jgi:arylsulfatase A-like enzyme